MSIPSNIAEGYKRSSNKDSVHFYNIALSSLEEVKYQLILSKDLDYLSPADFNVIFEHANEAGRILCGWSKSQA